jgi:hypothetical protein
MRCPGCGSLVSPVMKLSAATSYPQRMASKPAKITARER